MAKLFVKYLHWLLGLPVYKRLLIHTGVMGLCCFEMHADHSTVSSGGSDEAYSPDFSILHELDTSHQVHDARLSLSFYVVDRECLGNDLYISRGRMGVRTQPLQ